MAYIDNSQTNKEMNEAIRGNSVSNIAPSQLNNSIQPVININPKDYRMVTIVKTAPASDVIYTTPTDKKFILTGVLMNAVSTAAGTNYKNVGVTLENGESVNIASIFLYNSAAITATQDNVFVDLSNKPVVLKKGTTITQGIAGTMASSQTTIYGYTVEE